MAGVRLRGEADIRVAPIQVFQPLGELDTGEGHGTHIEPWEKLSSAGECFTYPSPIPAGGIPMGSGSTPSEPEDWLDGLTRNQLALIPRLRAARAGCAHRSARHRSRVDRSFRGAWSPHSGSKQPIAPADPAFIHRPDYRTGVRRSRTLAAPARVADAEGKIPIRCIRNLRVWTAHHSLGRSDFTTHRTTRCAFRGLSSGAMRRGNRRNQGRQESQESENR